MAELIARRYSNALFELAKDEDKVAVIREDIEGILATLSDNPDFVSIICHPHITYDEKSVLLKNTFENKVDENILGLFDILLRKNREEELVSVLKNFVELAKEEQNETSVEIVTAIALSDDQLNKLVQLISKKINKTVSYTTVIDPAIIGGIKITVDGKVIDGTIANEFANLKKALYS